MALWAALAGLPELAALHGLEMLAGLEWAIQTEQWQWAALAGLGLSAGNRLKSLDGQQQAQAETPANYMAREVVAGQLLIQAAMLQAEQEQKAS